MTYKHADAVFFLSQLLGPLYNGKENSQLNKYLQLLPVRRILPVHPKRYFPFILGSPGLSTPGISLPGGFTHHPAVEEMCHLEEPSRLCVLVLILPGPNERAAGQHHEELIIQCSVARMKGYCPCKRQQCAQRRYYLLLLDVTTLSQVAAN